LDEDLASRHAALLDHVPDGKLGTATGIELSDDGGFHIDVSGDREFDSGQLLMARTIPTL